MNRFVRACFLIFLGTGLVSFTFDASTCLATKQKRGRRRRNARKRNKRVGLTAMPTGYTRHLRGRGVAVKKESAKAPQEPTGDSRGGVVEKGEFAKAPRGLTSSISGDAGDGSHSSSPPPAVSLVPRPPGHLYGPTDPQEPTGDSDDEAEDASDSGAGAGAGEDAGVGAGIHGASIPQSVLPSEKDDDISLDGGLTGIVLNAFKNMGTHLDFDVFRDEFVRGEFTLPSIGRVRVEYPLSGGIHASCCLPFERDVDIRIALTGGGIFNVDPGSSIGESRTQEALQGAAVRKVTKTLRRELRRMEKNNKKNKTFISTLRSALELKTKPELTALILVFGLISHYAQHGEVGGVPFIAYAYCIGKVLMRLMYTWKKEQGAKKNVLEYMPPVFKELLASVSKNLPISLNPSSDPEFLLKKMSDFMGFISGEGGLRFNAAHKIEGGLGVGVVKIVCKDDAKRKQLEAVVKGQHSSDDVSVEDVNLYSYCIDEDLLGSGSDIVRSLLKDEGGSGATDGFSYEVYARYDHDSPGDHPLVKTSFPSVLAAKTTDGSVRGVYICKDSENTNAFYLIDPYLGMVDTMKAVIQVTFMGAKEYLEAAWNITQTQGGDAARKAMAAAAKDQARAASFSQNNIIVQALMGSLTYGRMSDDLYSLELDNQTLARAREARVTILKALRRDLADLYYTLCASFGMSRTKLADDLPRRGTYGGRRDVKKLGIKGIITEFVEKREKELNVKLHAIEIEISKQEKTLAAHTRRLAQGNLGAEQSAEVARLKDLASVALVPLYLKRMALRRRVEVIKTIPRGGWKVLCATSGCPGPLSYIKKFVDLYGEAKKSIDAGSANNVLAKYKAYKTKREQKSRNRTKKQGEVARALGALTKETISFIETRQKAVALTRGEVERTLQSVYKQHLADLQRLRSALTSGSGSSTGDSGSGSGSGDGSDTEDEITDMGEGGDGDLPRKPAKSAIVGVAGIDELPLLGTVLPRSVVSEHAISPDALVAFHGDVVVFMQENLDPIIGEWEELLKGSISEGEATGLEKKEIRLFEGEEKDGDTPAFQGLIAYIESHKEIGSLQSLDGIAEYSWATGTRDTLMHFWEQIAQMRAFEKVLASQAGLAENDIKRLRNAKESDPKCSETRIGIRTCLRYRNMITMTKLGGGGIFRGNSALRQSAEEVVAITQARYDALYEASPTDETLVFTAITADLLEKMLVA